MIVTRGRFVRISEERLKRIEDVEITVTEEKLTVDKLQEIIDEYGTFEAFIDNVGNHQLVYKWENIEDDVKAWFLGIEHIIPASIEAITTVDKKKINTYRYHHTRQYGFYQTEAFKDSCQRNGYYLEDMNVKQTLNIFKQFMEAWKIARRSY